MSATKKWNRVLTKTSVKDCTFLFFPHRVLDLLSTSDGALVHNQGNKWITCRPFRRVTRSREPQEPRPTHEFDKCSFHFLKLFFFAVSLAFFSRVHATLHPALSVRPSVGWSVGRSVYHTFTFFYQFHFSKSYKVI